MSSARQVAAKVIFEIEKNGSYSNILVDSALKTADLSRVDSALASMLIYGVLQRKITLDTVLDNVAGKGFKKTHPFVLAVLRVGAYQLLFTDKIPPSAAVNEAVKIVKKSKQSFASGFVNAVLRRVTNEKTQILKQISESDDLSFKYSCTKELAESLINDYGFANACELLKSGLESPRLYCRKNNFCDNQNLAEDLLLKDIKLVKTDIDGAFYLENAGNVEALDEFQNGEFFVQDLASQIALSNFDIKDGMSLLDVCAAPGGKSFTAAQYIGKNGRVVSCDIYEKRVGLILSGAKRLKIDNLYATVNDATKYNDKLGLFDRVLCDVPCSGLGVIRRKPEIKYKDFKEFEALRDIQLKILETSIQYLKPDGLLMYSTCTLRNAENRKIVDEFINSHSDFIIQAEKTLMPHIDGSDGFYFCVLKRKNCGQN